LIDCKIYFEDDAKGLHDNLLCSNSITGIAAITFSHLTDSVANWQLCPNKRWKLWQRCFHFELWVVSSQFQILILV